MKKLMTLVFVIVIAVGGVFANTPSDYDQNLINALKDDNVGVRTSAAQLIGERKVEAGVEPLIKMVKSEKRPSARIVAAVALYKIGDEKVVDVLKKVAKNDRNITVRRVAKGLVNEFENNQFTKL